MKTFAQLGLSKNLLGALESQKITEPLEAQEKIVPLVLKGENVCFTSPTGTGKTLACVLGFLGKINPKLGLQLLVLTPTRELCIQFAKEVEKVATPMGLATGMLYGGRPVGGDYRTTSKKLHILVGTPGRVIQHVNAKSIKAGDVRFVVYDEADQMFESGFFEDCKYVTKRISVDAQVVLASATMTVQVRKFIEGVIGNHTFVEIDVQIPTTIAQEKISCDIKEKKHLLTTLLKKNLGQTMIFCNTKVKVESLADSLFDAGYKVKSLTSKHEQKERENRLRSFRERKIQLLVATDIAARGLHIDGVDTVINFDVPKKPEFYVHRIGRTGRNKVKGRAITLVCVEDKEKMDVVEKMFNIDIHPLQL